MHTGGGRLRGRLVSPAAVAVLMLVGAAGCGADREPGAELVGTWGGIYQWGANGASYAVTLVIPTVTAKGTKRVTFKATESAGSCPRVDVVGSFDVASRQVLLDEVATECDAFLLDGRYDGRIDTGGTAMNFSWGLDTDDGDGPPLSGTLKLTKLSRNVTKRFR